MRLLLLLAFLASVHANAESVCEEWFRQSGLSRRDKDCELKCDTLLVDMATFTCTSQCEKFCSAEPPCGPKKSWKEKIQSTVPPKWAAPEKPKQLTTEELQALENALQRLPDSFPVDNLTGIYILQKPRSIFSLGTPSSYFEGQLILYAKAFENPGELTRLLVHEFAHYLHENGLRKEFSDYKVKMKWPASGETRPGEFIQPDGKDSPEEDFANNFEAYLLEPEKLKKHTPAAFEWMKKNLKDQFKLKKACP